MSLSCSRRNAYLESEQNPRAHDAVHISQSSHELCTNLATWHFYPLIPMTPPRVWMVRGFST